MADKQKSWGNSGLLLLGYLALALLFGGIGLWSVKTNIAGAIVASGLIEVEVNRQVVQHPDGGVIGEILVDDGDLVEAGEVLMRFDDTLRRSELSVVDGQLAEIFARKARLKAERDEDEEVDFGELAVRATSDPEVETLIEGQRDLFLARRNTVASEKELLTERKAQISEQIIGSEAQMTALNRQLELVESELRDEQELLDKGLSQASTVRSLQREAARLEGSLGDLMATIAESRGRIAEIEIEVLRLQTKLREEAITELRDLEFREIELREKKNALEETLMRMDIRAPVSGVVFGNQFHAIRSVVTAAEPIMYIVPQDSTLVISTRIPTVHIDQVHLGQEASLQFQSFDLRTTPVIFGTVTNVSADAFVDDVTGESFYRAEIIPQENEMAKLDGLEIVPGMPVTAFLKTADRTPLQYLTKPLTDYFTRAFRED